MANHRHITPLKAEEILTIAQKYSDYIVQTHCTICEAAKHFGIPKSTLWYRLELLPPDVRHYTKQVAHENVTAAALTASHSRMRNRARRPKRMYEADYSDIIVKGMIKNDSRN